MPEITREMLLRQREITLGELTQAQAIVCKCEGALMTLDHLLAELGPVEADAASGEEEDSI